MNLKGWGKSPFSLSTLQRVATVWNDVRDAHYDVAVDLQGAMRSALLARLSGARVVYGAAEPRESPASLWYTRKAVTHGRHVIEQNVSVAEAAGRAPRWNCRPGCQTFRRDTRAEARIEERLAEYGIDELCHSESGRGLGREAMASRALW